MRALIQRVIRAEVRVDEKIQGRIGFGMLILFGVAANDTEHDADYLADKLIHLRIFSDDAGKMNRSALDSGAAFLVVSQFTLYGDCRKGRRPGFDAAAPPERARASSMSISRGKFARVVWRRRQACFRRIWK